MNQQKKKFIASIALIVLGVAFVGMTFLPGNAERQESVKMWNETKESGTETEGVLASSEVDSVRNGRRQTMVYCGVYNFTANGAAHTARAVDDDCVRDRSELKKGSIVTVVYDPERPNEAAFVKSDATEKFYDDRQDSQFAGLIFGVPMLLIGSLVMYVSRSKKSSPAQ